MAGLINWLRKKRQFLLVLWHKLLCFKPAMDLKRLSTLSPSLNYEAI
jgi:hypothetical protein